MKHIFTILITAILLNSCESPEKETFDRFIIATTYSNNNQTRSDSLEMTNTICLSLIYVDKNSNCYIYKRTEKNPQFYKCHLSKSKTESFKTLLNDLKSKFPKKYNLSSHCSPDITVICENDTLTDFRFIQTNPDATIKYIENFIATQTKEPTDTIETIMKYKSYIVSQLSYFNRDRYGFEPINYRYLYDGKSIRIFADSLLTKPANHN
ncbi:MAG: hypothetical protein JWO09_3454 [Bacteroidetes bacterium]|nr:hypothetical protein [Bacteroidota bacterium]